MKSGLENSGGSRERHKALKIVDQLWWVRLGLHSRGGEKCPHLAYHMCSVNFHEWIDI